MEREGTGKGRIMGKGGSGKGRERGKEFRVERENGRIKEKEWREGGWAGLGKGADGEVKYDLWRRLF